MISPLSFCPLPLRGYLLIKASVCLNSPVKAHSFLGNTENTHTTSTLSHSKRLGLINQENSAVGHEDEQEETHNVEVRQRSCWGCSDSDFRDYIIIRLLKHK